MRLNKIKLFALIWTCHVYIYYTLRVFNIQYESNVLERTFYNFKSFMTLFVLIPFTSFFVDAYLVPIPLLLMYYLLFWKKIEFISAYLIAIAAYYVAFLIDRMFLDSFLNDLEWGYALIFLLIAATVNYLLFRKTARRLDAENF